MNPVIKLDWSRLLGFDQAPRSTEDADMRRPHEDRPRPLGAKVGGKFGAKGGIKFRVGAR